MVPGKPEALSFWGGGVVGERRKYRKSAFSFTWLTLSGTLIALGSGLYGLMDIVLVLGNSCSIWVPFAWPPRLSHDTTYFLWFFSTSLGPNL